MSVAQARNAGDSMRGFSERVGKCTNDLFSFVQGKPGNNMPRSPPKARGLASGNSTRLSSVAGMSKTDSCTKSDTSCNSPRAAELTPRHQPSCFNASCLAEAAASCMHTRTFWMWTKHHLLRHRLGARFDIVAIRVCIHVEEGIPMCVPVMTVMEGLWPWQLNVGCINEP